MKKLGLTLFAVVLTFSVYSCRETTENTETTVEEVETDLERTGEEVENEFEQTETEVEREVEENENF